MTDRDSLGRAPIWPLTGSEWQMKGQHFWDQLGHRRMRDSASKGRGIPVFKLFECIMYNSCRHARRNWTGPCQAFVVKWFYYIKRRDVMWIGRLGFIFICIAKQALRCLQWHKCFILMCCSSWQQHCSRASLLGIFTWRQAWCWGRNKLHTSHETASADRTHLWGCCHWAQFSSLTSHQMIFRQMH